MLNKVSFAEFVRVMDEIEAQLPELDSKQELEDAIVRLSSAHRGWIQYVDVMQEINSFMWASERHGALKGDLVRKYKPHVGL
jgi:hypothetical protein